MLDTRRVSKVAGGVGGLVFGVQAQWALVFHPHFLFNSPISCI